jgi:Uma2 family endonuclease
MPKPAETLEQRRFTVEEYHRMAEAGVLSPDERVELLFGVIHRMNPTNRVHVIAENRAFDLLRGGLQGRARVYKDDPLRADRLDSEPEPDVMVCSNPELEAYGAEETKPLLVLEVSDSSLGRDLDEKAILYAKAKVPEYWVVNLVDGVLEVFRAPPDGSYRAHLRLGLDAQVIPQAWPDLELDVSAFFPTDLTNLHRPEALR